MSTVISMANQKGGVGKTTTTGALAVGLHTKGFKVLAIDLDPQGNLTFSLGGDNEINATIYDVLREEVKVQHAIQHLSCTDLIAANILLSGIELEFTNTGREFLLRTALAPILPLYDYILIDTPPALGILTVNAFTASDYIVVPMLSDIFSLQGITQLHDTVERVRKYCNKDIHFAGILLNRSNPRTLLSTEIRGTAKMISDTLSIPLFNTSIRSSVTISEAQSLQSSLFEYAPTNIAVKDYAAFTNELLKRGI
ncbi:MAG: AAA family ATPase [Hydrogenoanaerobacterium sp.]